MEGRLMKLYKPKIIRLIIFLTFMICRISIVEAADSGLQYHPTNIRISGSFRIVSVSSPVQSPTVRLTESNTPELAIYSKPPLAGFSPLVAITTSNERSWADFDYEHKLQSTYVGTPLTPSASENYVIGIFDSGSVVDLAAEPSDQVLGLSGQYLTANEFPIGGVSGTLNANISQPVGIFAAGLSAIQENGHLDLTQVVGHSNVSVLVTLPITCDNEETISAVVGTPLISFFTTVIRNDNPQRITIGDQTIIGPDIQIFDQFDPSIPVYPRSIPIEFGGLGPVTTASYYPDFIELEEPMFPTLLSMGPLTIPFGGNFFAEIGILHGEPSPTNPIQMMRVLVDTGAQSSIMSSNMAAKLNLPLEPDFTVNVCGIGGFTEDIPGYYVDYVKINAWGGALEFYQAPIIVLDMESPEGGPLDGILGMNFFWNRNIIFEPSLTGSGFLHVSEPVPFAYADLNFDGNINLEDFAILASAWLTKPGDSKWNPYCDFYTDEFIDMWDLSAFVEVWLDVL